MQFKCCQAAKTPPTRVIPVKTGIQDIRIISYYLDSRLRGNDTINKVFLLIWLNIAKNKPRRLAKNYCQHLLTKSLICGIVTCSEMRNRFGITFPTSLSSDWRESGPLYNIQSLFYFRNAVLGDSRVSTNRDHRKKAPFCCFRRGGGTFLRPKHGLRRKKAAEAMHSWRVPFYGISTDNAR